MTSRESGLWIPGSRKSAPRNDASHTQQLLRIAARDSGAGGLVEAASRGQVFQRIVLAHVIGIVGAHQHVVDAESRDQSRELLRCEHHGIEIDFTEITRWRLR